MIDSTFETLFEYRGYKGYGDYCVDSDVYFGKITGIKDLVTFESATLADLEMEFCKAVDDYMEFLGEKDL